MSQQIEKYLGEKNYTEVINQCIREKQYNLGMLLSKIITSTHPNYLEAVSSLIETQKTPVEQKTPEVVSEANSPIQRVMLLCNWLSSRGLCDIWNKMSKGDYKWNNIQIVWEEPADWYVVINKPPLDINPPPARTLVFPMEPHMDRNPSLWGQWGNLPNREEYKLLDLGILLGIIMNGISVPHGPNWVSPPPKKIWKYLIFYPQYFQINILTPDISRELTLSSF